MPDAPKKGGWQIQNRCLTISDNIPENSPDNCHASSLGLSGTFFVIVRHLSFFRLSGNFLGISLFFGVENPLYRKSKYSKTNSVIVFG